MRLTADDKQYILQALKARYDEVFNEGLAYESPHMMNKDELACNRRAQEKILGHKVVRGGYDHA